jgi:hypothetical protein
MKTLCNIVLVLAAFAGNRARIYAPDLGNEH